MNVFVRVIEVWKVSRRSACLELDCGMYGDLVDLQWESERKDFAYGEGLPGRAWALRRPVMLHGLNAPEFSRAKQAHRAGLEVAIAIPIFQGDFLTGVVIFMCGGVTTAGGALELWTVDDSGATSLEDGYYGSLSSLEQNSRGMKFPPGKGLPGIAVSKGKPILASPLSISPDFERAQALGEVPVTTGVALPVCSGKQIRHVVVLLSAAHTPIANAYALWTVENNKTLVASESSEGTLEFQEHLRHLTVNPGEGTIGHAWTTGAPMVCEDLGQERSRFAHWACTEGLRSACAIPFGVQGDLRAILTMAM